MSKNKNTISCSKAGIKVFIGHSKKNVKSATILVRSSAIKNSNSEMRYARAKKIPIYSRCLFFLDSRLLNLDPQPEEMILSDQKRIIVDSFARYNIVDPLKFLSDS